METKNKSFSHKIKNSLNNLNLQLHKNANDFD